MDDNIYIKTPIFASQKLRDELQLNVFYKMECNQPSGSFKIRGMENLCQHHMAQGVKRFIASSGGNAGYSMAYVAKRLGAEVKVVVPKSTSAFMIDKIRELDVDVEVHGEAWDEAHQYASQLADQTNAVYVSPFDDPLLWEGHASMIDECAEQMEQPDAIVVAVGGGGLLCGVLEGLKRNGWLDTKVITAETEGAASFAKSFKAGKLIELDRIASVATSLGAKKVAAKALEWAAEVNTITAVVSDAAAVRAAQQFYDECNKKVEPACGAALSITYEHRNLLKEMDSILVIACGGVNTP